MPTPSSDRSGGGNFLPSVPKDGFAEKITEALHRVISEVPLSREGTISTPATRAAVLAEAAARKAAMISGGMAIVPGPLGILTIIPALIEIWKVQRQLVADIAAAYGKTPTLSPTTMLYCLFRHGSATIFKETVIQVSGRLLVRQASLATIHELVKRVSVNVTQRLVGQFVSRFVPLVGSAALGAFTYWDTKKVAKAAIQTFEKELDVEAIEISRS